MEKVRALYGFFSEEVQHVTSQLRVASLMSYLTYHIKYETLKYPAVLKALRARRPPNSPNLGEPCYSEERGAFKNSEPFVGQNGGKSIVGGMGEYNSWRRCDSSEPFMTVYFDDGEENTPVQE